MVLLTKNAPLLTKPGLGRWGKKRRKKKKKKKAK